MKGKFLICIALFIVSCAAKPLDEQKARTVVEELISRTDKGDYEGLEKLYTSAFNASESFDIKKQKLDRLRYTKGPMISMEFVSATHVAEFGAPQQVVIKYRLKNKRMTSVETFTVEEDEGGYKIATHLVETEGADFGVRTPG